MNLFDLGIVLAVAFLLAALASVRLTADVLSANKAPKGSVIKNKTDETDSIQLRPGQQVVGRGKAVGTVYQLSDGRTIIVRRRTTTPAPRTAPGGTP